MKKHVLLVLLLCLALCLPALAAAEETAKPMIDVVWLIDTTGSIGSRISAIKNQMDGFAAQLTDFDVRYSLVAFGDEANNQTGSGFDFPEETVWLKMGSSHWTNSCETLKSYIEQGKGKLPKYAGGDTPETSTNAIVKAAEWIGKIEGSETWRDGAIRQFVLLTDAEPKDSKTYSVQGKPVYVYPMQQAIDTCVQRNISVSVASLYNGSIVKNAYKDLVDKTGGKYQFVLGSDTIASIGEWIGDAPVVVTQPEDQYVHEDDNVLFMATSLYGKKIQYRWYYTRVGYDTVFNGMGGRSSSTEPRFNPQHAQSHVMKKFLNGAVFYCTFTNLGDTRSIETRRATLFIASKFAITQQPQPQFVDAGQTATFTVVATGDDLTYQWQKQSGDDWVDLSGKTSATLSIPDPTLADNGSVYRCIIKDAISDKQPGGYTLTSESATLTMVAAPAITGQPASVIVTEGQDAVFTVEATGEGLKYQWQVFRSEVWMDCIGEESPTLTLPSTALTDDGLSYRCVVTSSHGTAVTSDAATLTVLAIPESPQTGDASRPLLWLALLGASLLGMTLLRRRRA